MDKKQIVLPHLVNSGIFARNRNVKFHSHPGSELILLTQGKCQMNVNGVNLKGGANNLFIIPAFTNHSQVNNGFVKTIYLSFRWEKQFDDTPAVIDLAGDWWIKKWMNHIYKLQHNTQGKLNELIPGLLYSILLRVEQLKNDIGNNISCHPAVSLGLEYLNGHIDKPVNIKEMAKYCMVSESYLCALFHKRFSKGPISIALEAKMQNAKRLLREPYLSVKEVAFACGFNDSSYFARYFRKIHKCSPGEYRSQSA